MPLLGPLNPAQLLSSGRQGLALVSRRARPDHQAINGRAVMFSPQAIVRVYLYAVVAPSRFAPRPYDDGQVARAAAFVADAFPGVFGPVPANADERLTLFTVEAEDQCRERALYVHRTGLIELLWALAPQHIETDSVSYQIEAAEIAAVTLRLAAAISRRPYTEIARVGRGRRRFGRVDWWFHLATGVSGGDGARYWTGLRLDGQTPSRAEQQYPAAPPQGYGEKALFNSKRSQNPKDIARRLLTSVLAENGYYGFSNALEETVKRMSDAAPPPIAFGGWVAQPSRDEHVAPQPGVQRSEGRG